MSVNNLVLIGVLAAIGAVLGTMSGAATKLWRGGDGAVYSPAAAFAASMWVLGMGARFVFAVYATHAGEAAVADFSFRNGITRSHTWQFAPVLMAYAEVLSRIAVLQLRRTRAQLPNASMLPSTATDPELSPCAA